MMFAFKIFLVNSITLSYSIWLCKRFLEYLIMPSRYLELELSMEKRQSLGIVECQIILKINI